MASKTTDNLLEICPLCSETIATYAIGGCDHPVCSKCSTRMRVLCEQLHCAICRADMPKVIFCRKLHKFHSIETHGYPSYRRCHVYFETRELQSSFFALQEHSCQICKDLKPFKTFVFLRNHMRKEHSLYYCDLCVEHLKIFTFERKAYDRKKLAEHRRVGDADDRSQSHKGHPLCQFCEQRYLDPDELARHLVKDHFSCSFCEKNGIFHQYYNVYADLRVHFGESHYLCEEGDCINDTFINAFDSEIDFKAHKSQKHGRGMTKAAAKKVRTIGVDIQYSDSHASHRDRRQERHERHERHERAPRESHQDRRQGYIKNRREREKQKEEEESAKAVAAVLTDMHRQGNIMVVDKSLVQNNLTQASAATNRPAAFEENTADFPTLDGRVATVDRSSDEEEKSSEGISRKAQDTLAKRFARANKFSVQDGDMAEQDFPSLGGKPVKASRPVPPSSAWEFHNSSQDFPSLGPSAAKKSSQKQTPHTSTWAVPKAQTNPPAPKKAAVVHSLSDFPSLSSIGVSLMKPSPVQMKSSAPKPQQSRVAQPATRTVQAPSHNAQRHKEDWTDNHVDLNDKTNVMFKNSIHQQESKIRTIQKVQEPSQPAPQNNKKRLTPADFPDLKTNKQDFPSFGKSGKKAAAPTAPTQAWGPKKQEPVQETPQEETAESNQFLKMKTTKNKKKKTKAAKFQETEWDSSGSLQLSDVEQRDSDSGASSVASWKKAADLSQTTKPPTKPSREETKLVEEPTRGQKNKQKKSKGGKEKKAAGKSAESSEEGEKPANKSPPSSKKSKLADPVSTGSLKETAKKSDVVEKNVNSVEAKTSASLSNSTDIAKPKQVSVPKEEIDFFPSFSEDFPSMLAFKDKSNLPNNVPAAPAFTGDDFPALGGAPGKKGPPPPPGFSGTAKALPPGFGGVTAPAQKPPPPGFTGGKPPPPPSSVQADSSSVSNTENIAPTGSTVNEVYTYLQPSNLQQRNQQLIRDIQTMLGNNDNKFMQFKVSSGEFRQGKISAADYYDKCSELLGETNFPKIFGELLVLLPDINKQQQLAAAHLQSRKSQDSTGKKKKTAWSSTDNATQFKTCPTCQQIVSVGDFNLHQGQHNSTSDFPSLGASAAPGIVGIGSWGRKH